MNGSSAISCMFIATRENSALALFIDDQERFIRECIGFKKRFLKVIHLDGVAVCCALGLAGALLSDIEVIVAKVTYLRSLGCRPL